MCPVETWESAFQSEIEKARSVRQGGNEGMARVCARRAAGIIIEVYLERINIDPGTTSAYDQIRILKELAGIPSEAREIAGYLLLRITPEHLLPVQVDLIAEVVRLKQVLMEQE